MFIYCINVFIYCIPLIYTHIIDVSFAAGGLIDKAHHVTKAHLALAETVELQNAVHLAVENTDVRDTLTVVTADHSHTMTIGGYPSINASILGKWGRVWVIWSLTHWGWVTHICVSKLTIIGSDNGLSPDRRQAIIWTNAALLLIGPWGTNLGEILIEILPFSFKKMRLKVSYAKRRPFCLSLNVLNKTSDSGSINWPY